MKLDELLQWQWEGYPRYHGARANLLIHIVAVPLFLMGNIALVLAIFRGSVAGVLLALFAMGLSVVLQGRGHAQEANPPEPFTSAGNALQRIFFEQWVTFPRFVLSGGWARALRDAN